MFALAFVLWFTMAMANAETQHPTNPSWPRKRRRQVGPADAGSVPVAATAARSPPFRCLVGRKYIKLLEKYIGDLRRHNPHPNRDLYFDDVVTILLPGFFNSDIRFPARRDLNSSVRCRALNSV